MEPENPNGIVEYTVSIVGVSLATGVMSGMSVNVTATEYTVGIQLYSNYSVVVTSRTTAGDGAPVSDSFQTPEGSEFYVYIQCIDLYM